MLAEKTYCISTGDTHIYLSESPEEFTDIVDSLYLNTWLITKEDLDNLVGYLAITYPNIELESIPSSTTYLKCVELPNQDGI